MKIAVLNECFLKDEHIARLKKLGEVSIYDDTNSEEKAIERLKGVEVALADCFVSPLNDKVFSSVKSLKYLSINSIGFDMVDLESASKNGIMISNIPAYSADAVAEHAIALTFAAVKHLVQFNKKVREKPYEVDPADQSQLPFMGFNLKNKTMGIIGLGAIGKRAAEIAMGLGMKVIAYNRSSKTMEGVEMVTMEELLRRSDIVSLHTPLNKDSENLIGDEELKLMPKHSVLINTARGKVVNRKALYNALKEGVIAGAGLDTLDEWDKSNELLELENVIITPHSAWYTKESFENLAEMVTANVEAYAKGEPINLVK